MIRSRHKHRNAVIGCAGAVLWSVSIWTLILMVLR